jgi:hypothetical protein
MRTAPEADDLALPPLDGAPSGDEPEDGDHDDDHLDQPELGDALDDATSEGDAFEELAVEGAEAGWLVDAEEGGKTLDVGQFDLSLADESELLEPDEPEVRMADEELGDGEETVHTDGGEEGPLAEDEELREEDLPALDADDDGDVADESLYERGSLEIDEELRWDDRAWARAPVLADGGDLHDPDDSGMLVVPGDDTRHAARDTTWKRLEEEGKVTAAVVVPGDSVIVALDAADRPLLVRILNDGVARIIAEIDTSAGDDEAAACRVTGLRWDVGRGCLVATGTFGAQAFRPA